MSFQELLDLALGVVIRKVVHRGYGATDRQIGHIYKGWRIVRRRKIPRLLRWYYDGYPWIFIGERVSDFEIVLDECVFEMTLARRELARLKRLESERGIL